MPFRSEAQRRYMWAKHPKLARKWTARYGSDVERSVSRRKQSPRRKRLLALGGHRGD